jgi:hypothetical protein
VPGLSEQRHLKVIWEAFDVYNRAAQAARAAATPGRSPADAARLYRLCARRILLANVMITAVEQDVVNLAVGETINQLPRLVAGALTGRLASMGEKRLGVPRELIGLEAPFELEPTTEAFSSAWARLVTEQILVLMLPNEVLRLGKDIPPRDPSLPLFPLDLGDLEDRSFAPGEADVAEVADLVATFDRSQSGSGSAAHDWRRYDDRMNWAVNMLRSRQQQLSLFWSPYTEEDQDRIVEGKLPRKGGDPSDYEVEAPLSGLPGLVRDTT